MDHIHTEGVMQRTLEMNFYRLIVYYIISETSNTNNIHSAIVASLSLSSFTPSQTNKIAVEDLREYATLTRDRTLFYNDFMVNLAWCTYTIVKLLKSYMHISGDNYGVCVLC